MKTIYLEGGYKVERGRLRVDRFWSSPISIALVAGSMFALATATQGATLFVLPIAIGFLRNRPMTRIIAWDLILGVLLIGWIVSFYVAVTDR